MKSSWRDLLITGMGTMLFTGLVSWIAFGQGTATKRDLKEHVERPAHEAQLIWNARVEAELAALREAQDEMLEKFAAVIARELDQRGVGRKE